MKETNPVDALHSYVSRYKNQRDAAKSLGISQQYLNDLLRTQRGLSPRMLAKLGLKRIVVTERTA